MGAQESRATDATVRSNSREPSDDSSQIPPKPLAIAGVVAGAVAGAVVGGILAWEMISSAAYNNPDVGDLRLGTSSSSSSSPSSPVNSSISGLGRRGGGGGDAVWRLNTDGSHRQHGCRRGGLGGIIVDGGGAPVAAFCRAVPEEDVLVHELQAIAEGLRLARRLGTRRIAVATDSTAAKDHLEKAKGGKLPREKLVRVRELVLQIGKLRRKFRTCEVGWVPKKSNEVAHFFAERESRSLEEGELRVWKPAEFPATALELLKEDANADADHAAGFL